MAFAIGWLVAPRCSWLPAHVPARTAAAPRLMLVTLVWSAAAAVRRAAADAGGAPPGGPVVHHAYFEAVSGLTTTGSTVLTGLDRLPTSINVWRTFMQWLGGMGI
jgi:trk system potassium uptake protein TrkH